MKRQCERQVGVRPVTIYNAVTIPRAVICPHNAEPGSKFCADHIRGRLEHLRREIRAERISYGEIAELQELAEFIEPDDVELLAWVEHTSTSCQWCGEAIDPVGNPRTTCGRTPTATPAANHASKAAPPVTTGESHPHEPETEA